MRLTSKALGALAAAGILAATLPGVAHAQPTPGTIYVGKKKYVRPSIGRCYEYKGSPIKNATGRTLYIYKDDECDLGITVEIHPGAAILSATGRSFRLM